MAQGWCCNEELLGGITASAGEMMAVALKGRSKTFLACTTDVSLLHLPLGVFLRLHCM
jgi:hypothetical protein